MHFSQNGCILEKFSINKKCRGLGHLHRVSDVQTEMEKVDGAKVPE